MTNRYQVAKDVAVEAGKIALGFQRQLMGGALNIEAKGVQDFVTEADQQVEIYIRQTLERLFPDDGFFGEESESDLRPGNGFWVVDPIDGTSNFMRLVDQWGISIAYVADGEIQLGVIYDPVREQLFHSCKGQGAYCNEQRYHLAADRPADPTLILGYSRRAELNIYLNVLEYLHTAGLEHRRFGSAALGLAHVVTGQTDGYYEADLNPWDCMAGLLMIEEAGGVVVSGSSMVTSLQNCPVAAGIPALKEQLSGLVALANA